MPWSEISPPGIRNSGGASPGSSRRSTSYNPASVVTCMSMGLSRTQIVDRRARCPCQSHQRAAVQGDDELSTAAQGSATTVGRAANWRRTRATSAYEGTDLRTYVANATNHRAGSRRAAAVMFRRPKSQLTGSRRSQSAARDESTFISSVAMMQVWPTAFSVLPPSRRRYHRHRHCRRPRSPRLAAA